MSKVGKVLIYGFGWCGQSMLQLCEDLRIQCNIVDEGLDISLTQDIRFIEFCDLRAEYIIYFICTAKEDLALKMFKKLLNLGIDEHRIKFFKDENYHGKMSFLIEKFFLQRKEVLQEWLNEERMMPRLHQTLHNLLKEYRVGKQKTGEDDLKKYKRVCSNFRDLNIFSKLYETTLVKTRLNKINYPGFNIGISYHKTQDRNFYFIKPIDFDRIANRSVDEKLMVCFGNSALRVEYLPVEQSITGYMEKYLKGQKYIILNCGVTGYTIYEQLMLYNALIYPLKPDVVVSFFLGTDFRSGVINCEHLVKTHKMLYGSWWYEGDYKKISGSELPLRCQMYANANAKNNEITDEDIYKAVSTRLNQFREIVCGGGAFMSFIQPLLPCKLKWTKEEQEMRNKERELLGKVASYQNILIDRFDCVVEGFKQYIGDIPYIFDLNEVIRYSEDSLFTNHWIHCNALGNEICAKKVIEILKQKEMIV